MSDSFLIEYDFFFQSNNNLLKEKVEEVTNHINRVLLDLTDEDIGLLEVLDNKFESVKNELFNNLDKIVQMNENDVELVSLYQKQARLLDEWKKFELTEDFFHRMYQIERDLLDVKLTDIKRERLELLYITLNEEIKLVLAFNVLQAKTPHIIYVEDYM